MSPDDLANSGHYGLLASGIPYMLNIVKRGVVFNDVKYDYMRIRSKTMRNLDALQREVDRISQTVTAKRILHLQKQVQQLQSGFELSKGTACHQNSPSGDQVKISKESLDEDRDREDDESAGAGDSNGANKDKSESSHPTLPVSPDPTPSTPPPHPMKSVKDKLAIPSAPQPIEPAVPIVPMKGRAYDDQFILRLLVEITILGVLAKILVMLKDVGGAQTAERK